MKQRCRSGTVGTADRPVVNCVKNFGESEMIDDNTQVMSSDTCRESRLMSTTLRCERTCGDLRQKLTDDAKFDD